MELSTRTSSQGKKRAAVPVVVTLAFWRIRRTAIMLCVTGIGMVAAIMLVCVVPLFSQVAMTAGLRGELLSVPDSQYITLKLATQQLTSQSMQTIERQFISQVHDRIGQYLSGPPDFSLQTPAFALLSSGAEVSARHESMGLYATSMEEAARHISLLRGRLPQVSSNGAEIVLTAATAAALHVDVGSVLTIQLKLIPQAPHTNNGWVAVNLALHIVGIVNPLSADDTFFHGADIQAVHSGDFITYQALMPNDGLVEAMARLTAQQKLLFIDPVTLNWYYHLDSAHLTNALVQDLTQQLATLQTHVASGISSASPPYVQSAQLSGRVLATRDTPGLLESYQDRINVAQIPVTILSLQVLALVLFFIGSIAELLVERQTEAIAILRSRGASQHQVFGSLMVQCIGLGGIALITGPLLAMSAAYFIAQHILSPAGQEALNVISSNPLQVYLGLYGYAVVVVLVAIVVMLIALYRATSLDVLALRLQSARATRRSLWRRLHLDVVAASIALTGYGMSQYVLHSGILDARSSVLLATPLALVAPLFLAIAGVLLFLRFFSVLVRMGALFARRGRGATALLALAQMGRAPGQFLRVVLLLAFATAFAIFSLVFTASQTQHTLDIASYQVSADFSGTMATPSLHTSSLEAQEKLYQRIPGVISVSAGYRDVATTDNYLHQYSIDVEVDAVDAAAFAQSTRWVSPDQEREFSSLMYKLSRAQSQGSVIPAIVDASLWQQLSLEPGTEFTLVTSHGASRFRALAEIAHIPQVNDAFDTNTAATSAIPGGIIVNYENLFTVDAVLNGSGPSPNYVWLRTQEDANSLASVRTAVSQGPLHLSQPYDRAAIVSDLQADPLFLDLIGTLSIGATTALLLSFIGALLASWLSARTRLTGFTLLRALGTVPAQMGGVLLWEQGVVYTTAILLGVLFGLFLSFTIVPVLVFTGTPVSGVASQISSAQFYLLQQAVPTQVVLPASLGAVLVALVMICVVTLAMMVGVVARASMSQVLRLNQD